MSYGMSSTVMSSFISRKGGVSINSSECTLPVQIACGLALYQYIGRYTCIQYIYQVHPSTEQATLDTVHQKLIDPLQI
jgi:hypothetical protein